MGNLIIQQIEESPKRNKLKQTKPAAYEKVIKFDDTLRAGNSVAILQFQFDYACNFNCIHCSIKKRMNPQRRKLTWIDVTNIAMQAHDLGLARWVFTGGEPLVSKNLEPFVKAIDPSKWYISCDSNGWLLDRDKAKHLKSLGIDRVQLSIDGLDANEHDGFRRQPGSFERCIRAIDYIREADLDLFVQTVATKRRLRSPEFVEFIKYLNGRDIGVYTSFAKPVGNFEGNLDCLINQQDLEYFQELERAYNVFSHLTPAYGMNTGCPAVKEILSITPYGDVLACQYMPISIGSLLENSLADIIKVGLGIKWFGEHVNTCPPAANREFVEKYIVGRTYGIDFPVPWFRVFTKEDETKISFKESL